MENKPKMAYRCDLAVIDCHELSWTVMDDYHGWLSLMTFKGDFHGWLSWMTFMDYFHGQLSWMTELCRLITDRLTDIARCQVAIATENDANNDDFNNTIMIMMMMTIIITMMMRRRMMVQWWWQWQWWWWQSWQWWCFTYWQKDNHSWRNKQEEAKYKDQH